MRAYFFTNQYLSSIQNGIQSQHCTAELFIKYPAIPIESATLVQKEADLLYDWATNHKTTIILNGGYSENLRGLIRLFDSRTNPYPWSSFNEGEDALDGALTCVGIVLPEKIYALSAALRSDDQLETYIRTHGEWGYDYREAVATSKFELDLALELNKYGLAS